MIGASLKRLFVDAMAKHLPPSAADLRLLDVNGAAGEHLSELRADLQVIPVAGVTWQQPANTADAVVAFAVEPDAALLEAALEALRPGGRLIILLPDGELDEAYVETLETARFTRILVEIALGCPVETGLLVRGEKPHTTADTLARIAQVAVGDADDLSLADFKGRYVHLLVRQTPNKPVWKLAPDEVIVWEAAALDMPHGPTLLAFSSLPKAVGFMQPVVLAGTVRDVNKVPKFQREVAQAWPWPVLLNPTSEVLDSNPLTLINIDPQTAETPDE